MAHEPAGGKPLQLRSYPAHRQAHYHTNIRTSGGETFRPLSLSQIPKGARYLVVHSSLGTMPAERRANGRQS